MKYMKLGSKPDIFQISNNTVSISSELASDITFQVAETTFHLHKFPLLSKCTTLQRLVVDSVHEGVVRIDDIPGGVKAFELCAKFCYGITITLNAYNVMNVRCAADYLGMTEGIDKGNLIFKLEVFLSSSIFKSWKDSIIALKTTKPLLPWSQDLQMISRCIDSIASKTSVDPSKVDWSYTYTRKQPKSGVTNSSPMQNGVENHHHPRHAAAPKDWWVEDICDLDIDFYFRVMVAIKTKGRMSHKLVGEALRVYAYRWLPGISKEHNVGLDSSVNNRGNNPCHQLVESTSEKHKMLLETIIGLMPTEKGSCSCSFMLRLLKAATILGADVSAKMDLARRIGLQLEEASLNDILIPSLSYVNDTLYDVDLMHRIVDHFLLQDHSPSCSPMSHGRMQRDYEKRRSLSADHLDYLASHASAASHTAKLKVAKLIDAYLAEIGRDSNLPLAKFIALAETMPEFARPVHDGLYRAIDIYLKEHPGLTKSEKKRLCRLMDCKKLSMDACMHAAQNERLPLRVVVQVLFFEQVRTAMTGGLLLNELPNNIKALLPQAESSSDDHIEDGIAQSTVHSHEEEWDSVNNGFNALKGDVAEMKQKIARAKTTKDRMPQQEVFVLKQSKAKNLLSNSKKMLNRLLSVKHSSSAGSKDSDRSKSSGSSVSSAPSKVEVENITSSTTTNNIIRRRRHSVS